MVATASGYAMGASSMNALSSSEISEGLNNSGIDSKSEDARIVFHSPDFDERGIKRDQAAEMQKVIGSPGESQVSSTTKGHGLKKWRRIMRGHVKDGDVSVDPNRILKRGFPNLELGNSRAFFVENKQNEVSGSRSVFLHSTANDAVFNALPVCGSDSESRVAFGNAFATPTNSENSEDQSSKSTAASAPKMRLEVPLVMEFAKGKSNTKNSKSPGNVVRKAQQVDRKIENKKKFREERVKVRKEHSHSSLESDSRSSNVIHTEGDAFAPIVRESQREGSSNCDENNPNASHFCELQFGDEVQADFREENGKEAYFVSTADVHCLSGMEESKESKNTIPNVNQDPLYVSISLLQAAQEALENEIRSFRDIGKNPVSPRGFSSCGDSSSAQALPEEIEEISSAPEEHLLAELSLRVRLLEHELEVANAILKAKELKMLGLESSLDISRLPKEKTGIMESLGEVWMEMERGLENATRSKMEAEVEFHLILWHTQEMKIAEERSSLLEQLKTLAENHGQLMMKLRDAEDKVAMLKAHEEELEAYGEDLSRTNDVLKMQNNVCKFTLFGFAQLMLLCMTFAFFLLRLLPHSNGVVPT